MNPVGESHSGLGERLTGILRTAQANVRNVRSFMRVMEIGLNAAGPELYPMQEESMRELIAENEWYAPERIIKFAASKALQTRLNDAAAAAEAAILLFGHSLLDAVTIELCELLADAAPQLWEDALGERRVRMTDLRTYGTYQEALKTVLKGHIADVGKNSLVDRIKLITVKCYPGTPPIPVFQSMWGGDFKLDLGRIKKIDERRHALIHEAEFSSGHDEFEDDLEYCELALTFLVKIVSFRFAIPLGEGLYGPGVEKLTEQQSN